MLNIYSLSQFTLQMDNSRCKIDMGAKTIVLGAQ
jgi:hypothetical protein